MSQVLQTFDSAVRTAVREPLYLLVVVVASIGAGIAGVVLGLIPIVGPLINGVVLTPALLVATLGAAYAVRHGQSAVDGATDALDRSTGAVIGAYAILMGAYVAALIVLGVLFFLVGAGGSLADGSSALQSLNAVLFVVLGLAVFVVAIAVGMAVQFVAPAAVVAGTGAVDSLRTAYRFFRRNLPGVVGFSLVLAGVGLLGVLVIVGLYVGGRAIDPLAGAAFGVLGYLGLLLVLGIVTPIYQVTYFEETIEDDVLPEGHEWPDEEGDDAEADAGDEVEAGDADAGGFAVEMAGDERGQETENPDENGSDEER